MRFPKAPNPLEAYKGYAKKFGQAYNWLDGGGAARTATIEGKAYPVTRMEIPFGPGGALTRTPARLAARGVDPLTIAAYADARRLAEAPNMLPLVNRAGQSIEPGALQAFASKTKMFANRGKSKIRTTNTRPLDAKQRADMAQYPTPFDDRFTAIIPPRGRATLADTGSQHHGELAQHAYEAGVKGARHPQAFPDEIQVHAYETVKQHGIDVPGRMGLGSFSGSHEGTWPQEYKTTGKMATGLVRMVRDMKKSGVNVGPSPPPRPAPRAGQAGKPSLVPGLNDFLNGRQTSRGARR